jgi:hypothetical protein
MTETWGQKQGRRSPSQSFRFLGDDPAMRTSPISLTRAGKPVALLAGGVALGALALGIGSAASSAAPARANTAKAPTPAKSFSAKRLTSSAHGVLRPGSKVTSRALGTRVFTSDTNGFALANVQDVTYPAATSDGGKTWRTNGPELHLPAAQAPLVVTMAGAAKPKTDFAWGGPGGGNAIDVTTDGGKTWWQSLPEGIPLSVSAAPRHRLIAVVQASASPSGTTVVNWVYVSKDGGRHWRYDTKLGAM